MKIAHIADIQVKNRDHNLFVPYQLGLNNILDVLKNRKDIEGIVMAGDFFEYAVPEEFERTLIYDFVSKILSIDHIKEIVLINGNHDLEKLNKKKVHKDVLLENDEQQTNAIELLDKLIRQLDKSNKVIYLKDSGIYDSVLDFNIKYVSYSLEDGMNPDLTNLRDCYFNISVFHAMLKEYVESVNLPLRKDLIDKLFSIEQFPHNSLIMAGDIHESLNFKGSNGQDFYYPGSTQQHTHGEGDYYKVINSELIHSNKSDKKYINVYDIDVESKNYTLEKIPINDYVKYVDIVINPQEENQAINGCNEFLKNFNFGLSQTYLKIKLPVSMLFLERRLFELFQNSDFNKSQQFGNIKVTFENEKISKSVNRVESEAVQAILNEVITNVDDTTINLDDLRINKDNIDSLILSDEQISRLFENVADLKVETIVKKQNDIDINSETLKNDIRATFDEQLKSVISESKSKRFVINLNSISCSSFMALGENFIQLDLPGITRILGTNKMGKTTLFRMIRWALCGEVYTGMKSNTVNQNNLIVFNNQMPEIDDLQVQLNMTINNTPIVLRRSLSRKWKNNVTSEQKQSKLWKDYISAVSRDITCTINPGNSEKEKTIKGESAELSIQKWFGDSIDNILMVNQFTIDSLLKSPPSKLNNMVLGFIGVDYLQSLENNLDNVKKEIMVTGKPTVSKEDIISTISKLNEQKNERISELDNLEKSNKQELNDSINSLNVGIDGIKNEMISLGDIPTMINENTISINDTQSLIDNFIPKEPKTEITFTEIKPILDQESIDELNKSNENLFTEYNRKIAEGVQIEQDLKKNNESLNTLFTNFLEKIDEKFKTNETKIAELQDQFQTHLSNIDTTIEIIKSQLDIKSKECDLDIFKIEQKINNNNIKIEENDRALDNNICQTCNRPLTDTPEEFETLKIKISEENKNLENLNIELLENKSNSISLLSSIGEDLLRLKNLSNYQYFEIVEIVNVDYNVSKIQNIKDEISLLRQEITKIEENDKKLISLKDMVKEASLTYITNTDTKEKFILYQTKYFGSLQEETKTKIYEYVSIIEKKSSLDLIKETFKSDMKLNDDKISNIKSNHTELLNNYQTLYETNIKENEGIRTFNETIRIHNESLNKNKLKLSELKDLSVVLNTIKLPKYNELREKETGLKTKHDEYKEKLDSLNEKISECKISLTNLDNSLNSFNEKYNLLLKYKHEQILYKIYDNLIKDDFKLIIFEYYRTFLNNTLSQLLDKVDFELFWDSNSNLFMITNNNGVATYSPVSQLSGMETIFCGLSLIYTMAILNIKNSLSHILVDELSGQLSEGKNLTYKSVDYQKLYVDIIHKFEDKSVFVVDHNIKDFGETTTYEVKKEYDKQGNTVSIYNKI